MREKKKKEGEGGETERKMYRFSEWGKRREPQLFYRERMAAEKKKPEERINQVIMRGQ